MIPANVDSHFRASKQEQGVIMNSVLMQLKNHPSMVHTQDVATLCQPLAELNISTFSHVRMTRENSFSALITNPAFMENYIAKQHYNADIHADPKHCHLLNCLMWDHIEAKGQVAHMLQDAADFQYNHIFTIIKKTGVQTDLYHFGTHLKNDGFNQIYINQYDLLEKFIGHFNDRVRHAPQLKAAYDIEIELDNPQGPINTDDPIVTISEEQQNRFLSMVRTDLFSPREHELIPMMTAGKTSKEIATALGLSCRTIEAYIDTLKNKLRARNKAELISKLLNKK